MGKVRQGLVCGMFSGDVCCADEGGALFLVEEIGEEEGKRGKGRRDWAGGVHSHVYYPHTHIHTPSHSTLSPLKQD